MYDWPEITTETNQLFDQLKQSIGDAGFNPPEELTREGDLWDIWKSPRLLLGQTCGLPLCTDLKGKVTLLGTPTYDIDCDAGLYCSVIVVKSDSPLAALVDLKDKIFAYNAPNSQSGYAAMINAVITSDAPFNPMVKNVETGSHRNSIKAVATGIADFAAIDAISWQLALRHEPDAKRLRVLQITSPTPALPFITAHRPDEQVEKLQKAIKIAMKNLDVATKENLLLTGFKNTTLESYQIIETRFNKIKTYF